MNSGFWRGALFRLLAVALAIGTVSDGRTSRIAYAQGATDPTVVKARAAINRGEYAEAEALLKPLATRTPDGEAALELGLFYEMMGRRDESLALLRRISDIQAGSAHVACRIRPSGPRRPRAGRISTRQRRLPHRNGEGAQRSVSAHRMGRAVSARAQQRRGRQIVPGCARDSTASGFPRSSGWRRRSST